MSPTLKHLRLLLPQLSLLVAFRRRLRFLAPRYCDLQSIRGTAVLLAAVVAAGWSRSPASLVVSDLHNGGLCCSCCRGCRLWPPSVASSACDTLSIRDSALFLLPWLSGRLRSPALLCVPLTLRFAVCKGLCCCSCCCGGRGWSPCVASAVGGFVAVRGRCCYRDGCHWLCCVARSPLCVLNSLGCNLPEALLLLLPRLPLLVAFTLCRWDIVICSQ